MPNANIGNGVHGRCLEYVAPTDHPTRKSMRQPGDKGVRNSAADKFWPGKNGQARKRQTLRQTRIRKWEMFYVSHTNSIAGATIAAQVLYRGGRQTQADRACAAICGFAVRAPGPLAHPADVAGCKCTSSKRDR